MEKSIDELEEDIFWDDVRSTLVDKLEETASVNTRSDEELNDEERLCSESV
jgi:hypothetical protein